MNEYLNDFKNWSKAREEKWEKLFLETVLKNNRIVKNEFDIYEKLMIIITVPFVIKSKGIGPSLFSLYREKRMGMFVEKLLLLLFGVIIWTGILIYIFEISKSE